MDPVGFSVDYLHEQAQRHTGLHDFGPANYLDGLRMLASALEAEANLNAHGRAVMGELILHGLMNRTYIEEARQRGRLSDAVPPGSLLILSVPRSGTTYLHHLLAEDPSSRALPLWELMAPAPPPGRSPGGADDPRMSRVEHLMKQFGRTFVHVHEMAPHLPDEDFWLDRNVFMMYPFNALVYVPSYRDWLNRQPPQARYDYFGLQLRILAHQSPARRFLLRSPFHVLHLDGVARMLPDLRVVHVHRDPTAALASICSLNRYMRLEFSDACDNHQLGRVHFPRYLDYFERARAWRAVLPTAMFFDLAYDDLMSQPLESVRRIYDHFGLPLSEEFAQRANTFVSRSPRHKHGIHDYSLSDYGLDAAEVASGFAEHVKWQRAIANRHRG